MGAIVQWYPGHIAKAERDLQDQLKRVDVAIEVRDARIPLASAHPKLPQWLGDRQHLLVFNREDAISPSDRAAWERWLSRQDRVAFFTNAQSGKGVPALLKAAQAAGERVNGRRQQRGMLPRPVRAVVMGFPNVGKSALINRLLNRRVAVSANRPGVTRQLRWIRLSDRIELLDTPGILPPVLEDQAAAVRLAICDDIGEAGYDEVLVAAQAVELFWQRGLDLENRYGLAPTQADTGMDYLVLLAATDRFRGDTPRVARTLLQDFRKGRLGAIALELPDGL